MVLTAYLFYQLNQVKPVIGLDNARHLPRLEFHHGLGKLGNEHLLGHQSQIPAPDRRLRVFGVGSGKHIELVAVDNPLPKFQQTLLRPELRLVGIARITHDLRKHILLGNDRHAVLGHAFDELFHLAGRDVHLILDCTLHFAGIGSLLDRLAQLFSDIEYRLMIVHLERRDRSPFQNLLVHELLHAFGDTVHRDRQRVDLRLVVEQLLDNQVLQCLATRIALRGVALLLALFDQSLTISLHLGIKYHRLTDNGHHLVRRKLVLSVAARNRTGEQTGRRGHPFTEYHRYRLFLHSLLFPYSPSRAGRGCLHAPARSLPFSD